MILDTNSLSAVAEDNSTVKSILSKVDRVAIPVIVIGEYRYGIRQSRNRVRYERWLEQMIRYCRVLIVDVETTDYYAEIRGELKREGRPIPVNDLWVAALVRQYALPLLSRDHHFDYVPHVKRISW